MARVSTDNDKANELRQRTAKSTPASKKSNETKTHSTRDLDSRPSSIGLDVLRGIVGLLVFSCIGSYIVNNGETYTWYAMHPTKRPWFLSPEQVKRYFEGPLLLTNDQLAAYDGSEPGSPIYLALNRTIYDVSASPHVYGPGGMYSSLAAKDASRSYITTCFDPVEDLVPYFGGVEEVYVPLWLSKRTSRQLKPELDKIAQGEVTDGKDAEDIMEDIKRKVGRKNVKKLQDEAYADARERVKEQVKTWEGMFERKNYPVVGRVIGVDENDENKWRHLGFCEESQKLRPNMAETVQKALAMSAKGTMNIGKMGGGRSAEDKEKENKLKKGKKKKKQAAESSSGDRPNDDMANARIEDMIQGGKYYGGDNKKARKIEEIMRDGPKGGDETRAKEAMDALKDLKREQGEDTDIEPPEGVPDEIFE